MSARINHQENAVRESWHTSDGSRESVSPDLTAGSARRDQATREIGWKLRKLAQRGAGVGG